MVLDYLWLQVSSLVLLMSPWSFLVILILTIKVKYKWLNSLDTFIAWKWLKYQLKLLQSQQLLEASYLTGNIYNKHVWRFKHCIELYYCNLMWWKLEEIWDLAFCCEWYFSVNQLSLALLRKTNFLTNH